MKLGTVILSLFITLFVTNGVAKEKAKEEVKLAGHISADDIKWVDGPPSLPPGAKMALLYGSPKAKSGSFSMRLKFPKNYKVPAHWHPTDERITVISGVLYFGLGKKLDKKTAGPLKTGAHGWVIKKTPHFAYTEGEETIVQLDAQSPWGITYIDKKDDPRKKSKKKSK